MHDFMNSIFLKNSFENISKYKVCILFKIMPNLFQETICCYICHRKKVIDKIKSKKFKNFVLNLYILMHIAYKHKRILDSNIGRFLSFEFIIHYVQNILKQFYTFCKLFRRFSVSTLLVAINFSNNLYMNLRVVPKRLIPEIKLKKYFQNFKQKIFCGYLITINLIS